MQNSFDIMKIDSDDSLLWVEAAESFDEAKVKAAYLKAQEIVWEECPWIFLHMQPDLNAVNKRLQGFEARLDEWLILTAAALVLSLRATKRKPAPIAEAANLIALEE